MSDHTLNTPILENCENLTIGIAFTLWNKEIVSMLKNSAEEYFAAAVSLTLFHWRQWEHGNLFKHQKNFKRAVMACWLLELLLGEIPIILN